MSRESLENLVPVRISVVHATALQRGLALRVGGGVITAPRLQQGCRNAGETSARDLCCTCVRVSVHVYRVLKSSTCQWG